MGKKYQLFEVKWVDSSWHQGWKTGLDTVGVSQCRTVGYVLRDNPEDLVIAMSVGDNGNFTEAMCIPQRAVISKKKVRAV